MYLPNVSCGAAAFDEALERLESDLTFYSAKPGKVLLVGDFNAHVLASPLNPAEPVARAISWHGYR